MKIIIYDTETSGLPNKEARYSDSSQPRVLQLAYGTVIYDGETFSHEEYASCLVYHSYVEIHPKAFEKHGLTQGFLKENGITATAAMTQFAEAIKDADVLIAFNADFDRFMLGIEFANTRVQKPTEGKQMLCAMKPLTSIMNLPPTEKQKQWGFEVKQPNLQEAHHYFFGEGFDGAHDALEDVKATMRIVKEMYKRRILTFNGAK